MASNNKLRETNIRNRAYHYFYDITNIDDLYFKNIKLDKKSYKDILFYYTVYEVSKGVKPFYCFQKNRLIYWR